jgi:CxxC-x17-CxxC domain-containing protein
MDAQFVDRILTCSDCHGEFIFTAGEQLFFHDKQFKNDPKRCKPCKLRRSGLAAVANGTGLPAAGLSRTETRTECSECGVQTTVPFKPTQGRPVLCRQCYQTKNKAIAAAATAAQAGAPAVSVPAPQPLQTPQAPLAMAASPMEQTASALTEAATEANGTTLSADAAVQAAASMAAASPQSSVATAADLASIVETAPNSATKIPTELLAAASESAGAELIPATVAAEAPKA